MGMNCVEFERPLERAARRPAGRPLGPGARPRGRHAGRLLGAGRSRPATRSLRQAIAASAAPRPLGRVVARLLALMVAARPADPGAGPGRAARLAWVPLATAAALLALGLVAAGSRTGPRRARRRPARDPPEPAAPPAARPALAEATDGHDRAGPGGLGARRPDRPRGARSTDRGRRPSRRCRPADDEAAATAPSDLLQSVGERVNAGVRPISGSARHAFGFLLGPARRPARRRLRPRRRTASDQGQPSDRTRPGTPRRHRMTLDAQTRPSSIGSPMALVPGHPGDRPPARITRRRLPPGPRRDPRGPSEPAAPDDRLDWIGLQPGGLAGDPQGVFRHGRARVPLGDQGRPAAESRSTTALLARSYADYAWALQQQGRNAEAEPLPKWALAAREASFPPTHRPSPRASTSSRPSIPSRAGPPRPSRSSVRAIAQQEKAARPDPSELARSQTLLGLLLVAQGALPRGRGPFLRAVRLREKARGASHPETGDALNNLARAYQEQRKYDQARPLFERALTIFEQSRGPADPSVALVLDPLARIDEVRGELEEAEAKYRRALGIWDGLGARPARRPGAEVAGHLADFLDRQGRGDEARKVRARPAATPGAARPGPAPAPNPRPARVVPGSQAERLSPEGFWHAAVAPQAGPDRGLGVRRRTPARPGPADAAPPAGPARRRD